MMVEDLGIEAKEAAVREVAKLLPLPELLQSISSIKADYITRQQVLFFFFNEFPSHSSIPVFLCEMCLEFYLAFFFSKFLCWSFVVFVLMIGRRARNSNFVLCSVVRVVDDDMSLIWFSREIPECCILVILVSLKNSQFLT